MRYKTTKYVGMRIILIISFYSTSVLKVRLYNLSPNTTYRIEKDWTMIVENVKYLKI